MNEVGTELITTRRVIFTPNVDIKDELKRTSINITCYDRNGNVVKRVTSSDDAEIEDNETVGGETDNGSSSGSNGSSGSSSSSGSQTGGDSGSGSGSSTGSETGGGDNGGGGGDVEGAGGDE